MNKWWTYIEFTEQEQVDGRQAPVCVRLRSVAQIYV